MSAEKVRRLTWILAGVAILAIGLAAVLFWRGFFGFAASRVVVSIEAPSEAIAGEVLTWRVEIENKNRTALENAKLTFEFPKASLDPESGFAVSTEERVVARLGKGEKIAFEISAVVIGGDNFERTARLNLRFQPEGSSLVFQKETSHTLRVTRFPVDLRLIAPQETVSGETISVEIALLSSSSRPLAPLRVRIEYPSGFNFTSSQSPLENDSRIWSVGQIVPQEEKNQEIFGAIWGSAGEGKIFRAFLEYLEPDGWVRYREVSIQMRLATTPLELNILLIGSEKAAKAGEFVNYELRWRNNFDIPLAKITLTAGLEGVMFDLASLETNGNVSAPRAEIVWTEAQLPELVSLDPGEEGSVKFRLRVKDSFPRSITKPTLTVRAKIESETKPPGVTLEKARTQRVFETRVSGKIELSSFALRAAGPSPLQVGAPTEFTIHWRIKTVANPFRDVTIKGALPSGVEWLDKTSVTVGLGALSYDSFSRQVTWNISSLPANAGVIGVPPEAVFRVRVIPPPSEKGEIMTIFSESVLAATDDFAQVPFEISAEELRSSDQVQ